MSENKNNQRKIKFVKPIKTNIIATIGSSTESADIIEEMIKNGLTHTRINMSHVTQEDHHKQIVSIRKAGKSTGYMPKILIDLAGPKIRTGKIKENTILKEGSKIILTTKTVFGDDKIISINYNKLPKEVLPGQKILVSDGKRILQVINTNKKDEIICRVLVGGRVTSARGINVPGADLTIEVITKKDKSDILFAIKEKADIVALSFVRDAKNIKSCKNLVQKNGGKNIKIFAKIETVSAVKNIEEIIKESDGVMVARGDLAMEIGMENVPSVQRKIIELSKKYNKYCIVATQVLDSMENSPTPTRAEVSDIAFGVYSGANAIMLSGETAIGKYPVLSVSTIYKVAKATEEDIGSNK